MRIVVRGDSVAAWCCAHLLNKAGFQPVMKPSGRPRVPAIMLSDAAVTLIRDVFDRPDLFLTSRRITRRVVNWGRGTTPLALAHSAVVLSERELLDELKPGAQAFESEEAATKETGFTIFAARPLPPESVEYCFGSRIASAVKVRLKDTLDSESCWIESLEDGWLFLIPDSLESGWLLSVGCPLQSIPHRSRLIAGRVEFTGDPAGEFPASPRIVSPLSGPAWLACGTAGMAFDPICGDGTAHAVREAILAAAVVRAISSGGEANRLRSHYEARLTLGFQRHLAACLNFYQTGDSGQWWDKELEYLRQGLAWCEDRMIQYGPFNYQLSGFELKSIVVSAA